MANATHPRTLLLIDRDPVHAEIFRQFLTQVADEPLRGEWVQTLEEGIERARQHPMWAIFLSLTLPGSEGLDAFERLQLAVPGIPILVLGSAADDAVAFEALRRGAGDYLLDSGLDIFSFVRAVRNMLARNAVRERAADQKTDAQHTLNSIGDAVISCDVHGNVTYLNVVAERMIGWRQEDALGRPLTDVLELIDGITREPCSNLVHSVMSRNKATHLTPNCILVRRDKREFAIEDSVAPIHDHQGAVTGSVMVFHDVSSARAVGLDMSHMAQHDALTNLPNRVLLLDRLNQGIALASRNGTRLAVLYLDLDGFKRINDSLGHAVGDKLLQSVAKRLLASGRTSDTVCRLGGDEFVVLLSEIAHARDAGIKAGKILNALLAPHEIDQYCLHVTGSVGVTTYPDDGQDAEILLKNADLAMYQAKENGRNNSQFFEKAMNVRAVERQAIEGNLRNALINNEFLMHYQPKIDLRTGAITGVEALVRWQHPDRGVIGPLQFVPVAEDCGLIVGIGRWVMREACRQAREWQDAGLPRIAVAVNVSSVEFRSADFLDGIRKILAETRLDPWYLELELTESVLMDRVKSTVPVLMELKAMGVRLAIDDFGTGYSSLSYLRQFPIDTLKVDQSFVRGIDDETDDATIISSVISMGRNLKHRVIAEGVETAQQLAFLQSQSCDEAQGFYFSRPLLPVDFARLLATGIPVKAGSGAFCR